MVAIFIITLLVLLVLPVLFLRHPKFGRHPKGDRLKRIQKSPHYRNGKFENLSSTPPFAEGTSMPQAISRFLFSKNANLKPKQKFLFTKTDLKILDPRENVYVWMGHSSYFLQIEGKRILVDPVLSGYASPISSTTRSFTGSDLYSTDDIPDLDYLIITHDHWDHLDYETVKKLKPKVKQVITSLGTAEHLEFWTYDPAKIIELDWYESHHLENGFKVHAEPARHFSGRSYVRNKAFWASFVFETPTQKIYIGADSGFDDHFEKIGDKYGGFDLAILENGQYNKDWPYIHLMPNEFMLAAKNLKTKRIIPVHNSKFALSVHDWKEPLQEISTLNEKENLRLITPEIGEKINWTDDERVYDKWWETCH